MTNNTEDDAITAERESVERENALLQMGYSSRDIAAMRVAEKRPNKFLNALGFIVEALADENVSNTDDIVNLDEGTFWEFSVMYNFDREAFDQAMESFRNAIDREVHNAFYNGDCHNCMDNPPTYN